MTYYMIHLTNLVPLYSYTHCNAHCCDKRIAQSVSKPYFKGCSVKWDYYHFLEFLFRRGHSTGHPGQVCANTFM